LKIKTLKQEKKIDFNNNNAPVQNKNLLFGGREALFLGIFILFLLRSALTN